MVYFCSDENRKAGTNMLRIALCDDETNARDALRFQLEKILLDGNEEIVYEFNSGKGAVSWLAKHPGEIDLLFLDVEMDEMNGMEAAMEIRAFNQDLMIVFVTGYTDYVFDGYKVCALDYIIKPAGIERLRELMERVRSASAEKSETFFTFQNVDGTFKVNLRDILYCYSEKRLVHLITAQREYQFYDKLDDVEKSLGDSFVRIHQRYLVNSHAVEHVASSSVTLAGCDLPISRALKESAAKKLAHAMLGGDF